MRDPIAILKPFATLRFFRLLLKTMLLKVQYLRRKDGDYRSFLNHYYGRKNNPFWEKVHEDKWHQVRAIVLNLSLLQESDRVLDVATGVGFQAAAFTGNNRFIVGLDFVLDRLLIAASRNSSKSLSWVAGDAIRLPFPSQAFPVVTISLALHDMPPADILATLRELRRVSCRTVVIVEPSLPRQRFLRLIYHLLAMLFDESIWISQYLSGNIESRLADAGLHLRVVETCYWGTLSVYGCEVKQDNLSNAVTIRHS